VSEANFDDEELATLAADTAHVMSDRKIKILAFFVRTSRIGLGKRG